MRSLWPINKGSQPASETEKAGLAAVAAGEDRFYAIEGSGPAKTLVAIYPDMAVNESCVACHNGHPDSPRRDFRLGNVTGGVVVRLRMSE